MQPKPSTASAYECPTFRSPSPPRLSALPFEKLSARIACMKKRMVVAGFAILISAPVARARGADFSGSLTNPNLVYVNLGAGVPLSDVDLTDQGEGESKVGGAGF